MGSNQSSTEKVAVAKAPPMESGGGIPMNGAEPGPQRDNGRAAPSKKERRRSKGGEKLEGFALVQHQCRREKRKYDRCYAEFYGAFVPGRAEEDSRDGCDDLFDSYRECVFLGMKRDRERRGVGRARPGSALAEFEEELDE